MAERFVYLVRHGQYVDQPFAKGGTLTSLGRRQAFVLAKRMSEWPLTRIHSSDLGRAVETAQILGKRTGLSVRSTPLLREMIPTIVPEERTSYADRVKARARLVRIARRYFEPAGRERHDVIICHGNLIRSLLCQLLEVPLPTWMRMHTHNCGITRLVVEPEGVVKLVAFNETGHLPKRLVTYT